jgi:PAS domain S-box-containing protein
MQKQLFDPQKEKTLCILSQKKNRTSEQRYRRLFETTKEGILLLDADSGKITDANPYLLNLVGYSETELLGKHLWNICAFKDIINSKKAFLNLQTQRYIRYQHLPLQTKYGKSITVEVISNIYSNCSLALI